MLELLMRRIEIPGLMLNGSVVHWVKPIAQILHLFAFLIDYWERLSTSQCIWNDLNLCFTRLCVVNWAETTLDIVLCTTVVSSVIVLLFIIYVLLLNSFGFGNWKQFRHCNIYHSIVCSIVWYCTGDEAVICLHDCQWFWAQAE